jgi:hypothetical protein
MHLSRLAMLAALLYCSLSIASAQQPFITDDADVTPKGKFHFEFSNEFDLLHRSAFPNLRQNTADFELDYGLFENVEIGIEAPLLTLINDRSAPFRTATGIGDMNLSLKYNFLKERSGSSRPALAVALNFELPTGNTNRQLGSGLADFYVNAVLQKSIASKTTIRLNGGLLFSGNETTGVVGVNARGLVFTSGGSVVKQFTPKLDLGFEINGALARNAGLGKGRLQFMIGGNYGLNEKMTIDFGIVAGRYAGSPRAGVQIGLSVDF